VKLTTAATPAPPPGPGTSRVLISSPVATIQPARHDRPFPDFGAGAGEGQVRRVSHENRAPSPRPLIRRVDPATFRLADVDPGDTGSYAGTCEVKDEVALVRRRSSELQQRH